MFVNWLRFLTTRCFYVVPSAISIILGFVSIVCVFVYAFVCVPYSFTVKVLFTSRSVSVSKGCHLHVFHSSFSFSVLVIICLIADYLLFISSALFVLRFLWSLFVLVSVWGFVSLNIKVAFRGVVRGGYASIFLLLCCVADYFCPMFTSLCYAWWLYASSSWAILSLVSRFVTFITRLRLAVV